MAKKSAFNIAKPKIRFHIDEDAKLAVAQSKKNVLDFADNGDEDAFVQQIKAADPRISPRELLEKIALFRELKRIRSRGGS
jgi:hypothetical protein